MVDLQGQDTKNPLNIRIIARIESQAVQVGPLITVSYSKNRLHYTYIKESCNDGGGYMTQLLRNKQGKHPLLI